MALKIAVVGGGIAGLASAYRLEKTARDPDLELTIHLFEREGRLGGKILTERADGFVIEGGPDAFVSTKPWGLALARELGLDDCLVGANTENRRVYVWRDGGLVELPDGLAMMMPTKIWPMVKTELLSPMGKARMGLDFFLPARNDAEEESLGAFVSRRLGRQAYERLIEPLMSGIYAGDGDQLSLRATFPLLKDWEQEYGSLTRGALALRRKQASSNRAKGCRSIFLTFGNGLSELVDVMVEMLPHVHMRLSTSVESIDFVNGHFLLHTPEAEPFDAVILATPAYASGEILRDMHPEMARSLRGIPYVSAATVSLAFSEKDLGHALDGHGYVIPRSAGRDALGCTWTSTKFPHRAPEGLALLRVFIGRAGREEQALASERDLVRMARREIAATMGIEAKPNLARVFRWPAAMPQYNLGHLERLDQIERQRERWPGLYLAGAAYRGIGIPDCIHSGELAAEAALELLE